MRPSRWVVAAVSVVLSVTIPISVAAQPTSEGRPSAPANPYVPPACAGIFSDVACPGGFAVNWIEQFYGDGITAGCATGPLRYCPDATVTRAQMAVFVEKAMRGTTPWSPGDLGNQNTAIGAGSLPFGVSGTANTAFGMSALAADGMGASNTGIGAHALEKNTTGAGNTAVGDQGLYANTNGQDNTAVGLAALGSNTLGSENTAVGLVAMEFNTTAGRNTAVGSGALQTQSYDAGFIWDSKNTAVGAYALTVNQPDGGNGNLDGTSNTALGADTLESNTTGYYDTAVGQSALSAATTGFDNTAIGWKAGARGGDSITGYAGSPVTFVSTTTGSYNTFVGVAGSTAQVDNCTAVGMDAYCDATNQVRLGNFFVGSIGGKVGWSALSDARAKTDIADLDLGLDFVLALRPVSFRYKGGNGRTDMGFIAQDVEELMGDGYNVLGIGGDKDRTLSLRYTDLIAPMVKAIQEQQATIAAQRAEIETLEAQAAERDGQRSQIEALLARVARLEAREAVSGK